MIIYKNKLIFFKSVIILCWITSLILFFNCPDNLDERYMSFSLINTFISTLAFFSYKKKVFQNNFYLSISSLFILSLIITHFQIPLLHVFGFNIETEFFINFIWADTTIGNLSVAISSLALISFYTGHITKRKIKIVHLKTKNYHRITNVLTLLSIIFYFLFFVTSGSYMYGKYGVGDQLIVSNYFVLLFNLFLKSALILKMYTINYNIKNISNLKEYILFIGFPITFLLAWHLLFSTFVGDRGPIIVYGLLYFGLYFLRISRKTLIITLCVAVIFPVVFSIIGASRSRVSNESFNARISSSNYETRYAKYFNADMPGLSTLELALSVRCLNHSIANVPKNYDYNFGLYQLKQILASVPFLVGIIENNFINTSKNKESSSDFISYLIQGNDISYGDATTPVADLYLDFGPIGVFLVFFLFGGIFKKADLIIFSGSYTSLFSWIAIMFFWSGAIYLGRATFLYYLQSIIQIYLLIVILYSLLDK